jgi:hypothetical protein
VQTVYVEGNSREGCEAGEEGGKSQQKYVLVMSIL